MTLIAERPSLSQDPVDGLHCHVPENGAHGHESHEGHDDHQTRGSVGRLGLALVVTIAMAIIQYAGALATGSLALLADTGHLMSDAVALALALGAAWVASRPSSLRRTFGWRRLEVLAAFVNGIALFGIAGYVMYEAFERIQTPVNVAGGLLLVIAVAGLAANALTLRLLGHSHSLNERAARLHVIGDLLGSVGVVIAGVLIYVFGWFIADPILSIALSLLVLRSAARVIHEAWDILLLVVPHSLDLGRVEDSLRQEPGVTGVHDLHVWSVSSGFVSLSGHVALTPGAEPCTVLAGLNKRLRDEYGIEHSTLQLEHRGNERDIHPGCEPCVATAPTPS